MLLEAYNIKFGEVNLEGPNVGHYQSYHYLFKSSSECMCDDSIGCCLMFWVLWLTWLWH